VFPVRYGFSYYIIFRRLELDTYLSFICVSVVAVKLDKQVHSLPPNYLATYSTIFKFRVGFNYSL
jgi:hypothetical protein